MGIPGILAFPPYRISCRISLVHPSDIAGHKWDILAISIAVRVYYNIKLHMSYNLTFYVLISRRQKRASALITYARLNI